MFSLNSQRIPRGVDTGTLITSNSQLWVDAFHDFVDTLGQVITRFLRNR